MMNATNSIATDLFYKIRSRFSGLKLGKETGEITINPEEARFFDFDYKDNDKIIGHVSISLAEENSIKVYFSTGITESMSTGQKSNWYGFLKELRSFAKRRLMAFDTRDIAKDNLDQRDYAFLSQNAKPKSTEPNTIQKRVGESVMNESQLYGTKTVSYQRLMDTRLIIKHSQTLNDDMAPGARSRNISALFVENQDGERFKYPFIHLAGARAMQRHVANGGLPYDEIGKSIVSMSEQIAQLRSFGNYVVRNDLMNSQTNGIVEQSKAALDSLREQIARLGKQHHYEAYKESFQAQQPLEVPEDVVEDFTDKFTVKNFKEDIKAVFPILYRLMKENSTVDYNDIVEMTTTESVNDEAEVDLEEDKDEFADFESWVMNLGEESAIESTNEEEKAQAVKGLQDLVAQHFAAGINGTNAVDSLKGIIENTDLFAEIKEAAKIDADTDVRPLVKAWLDENAPDIAQALDFGDMTQESSDGPKKSDVPAAFRKAKSGDDWKVSMKDLDDEESRSPTSKKGLEKLKQRLDINEVADFIKSFYDQESKTFPKGPEGVATMVGKKFGEQAELVARKFVERMAPQQTTNNNPELQELARIRQLSGLKSETVQNNESQQSRANIDWESSDVKVVTIYDNEYLVKETPEGRLLSGESIPGYWYADQNGGEREGYIDFVVNIDTGEIIESPEDFEPGVGYLDDSAGEFIDEIAKQVKSKLDNNEENVSPSTLESAVNEGMYDLELPEYETDNTKIEFVRDDQGNVSITKVMLGNYDITKAMSDEQLSSIAGDIDSDMTSPVEEFLISVDLAVEYDVSGSYRPATWGYHGGEPAEYPESEVTKILVVGDKGEVEIDTDALGSDAASYIDSKISNEVDNMEPDYDDDYDRYESQQLEDIKRLSGISKGIGF